MVIGVEFQGAAGGGDGFGGLADLGVDPGEMKVRFQAIGSEGESGFQAMDGGSKQAEAAEEHAEIVEQGDVFRKQEVGAEQELERLLGLASIAGEKAEPVQGAGMAGLSAENGSAKGFGFGEVLLLVERGGFVELGGGVHGEAS
jgi:hypothetical protein